MSIAEKQITIAENVPKVFSAGYEKGKAEVIPAKAEQEKIISITQNGTTEVLPDEDKTLSKVTVEVNVPSDGSLEISLIQRDMTEVVIPEGVTEIGEGAFYGCRSLTDISIPNSVTGIGIRAFAECSSLKSVVIPDSVTTMAINKTGISWFYTKAYTFDHSGVETVILSKNLEDIPHYAFDRATKLKKIEIPASVKWIGHHVFGSCYDLEEIIINSNPEKWDNPSSFIHYGASGAKLIKVILPQGFNHNNLDLSASKLYSVETIVSWGEALFDRTGLDPYTLTIGSKNIEKLSDEQKLIFTDKNWILK